MAYKLPIFVVSYHWELAVDSHDKLFNWKTEGTYNDVKF
jgi:hypothetical protein